MSRPDYTPREREILLHLAAGLLQKNIGAYLGITTETVHHHMTNIRNRAGGLTNEAIIADAVRHGVILGGEIQETRDRVLS